MTDLQTAYHKQCDEIVKLKDQVRSLNAELSAVYAGLAEGLRRGGRGQFTISIAEELRKAGFDIARPCLACGGSGRLAAHPCPVCQP